MRRVGRQPPRRGIAFTLALLCERVSYGPASMDRPYISSTFLAYTR